MSKIYVSISGVPTKETIDKVNGMYQKGNHVTYWSSAKDCSMLYNQLIQAGCLFHRLQLNRPEYDVLL
jgi:hypothetical protein